MICRFLLAFLSMAWPVTATNLQYVLDMHAWIDIISHRLPTTMTWSSTYEAMIVMLVPEKHSYWI